jgi:hypothetical protein
MHRIKEAANIIKKINEYKNNKLKDFELIKFVCNYFDNIKNK